MSLRGLIIISLRDKYFFHHFLCSTSDFNFSQSFQKHQIILREYPISWHSLFPTNSIFKFHIFQCDFTLRLFYTRWCHCSQNVSRDSSTFTKTNLWSLWDILILLKIYSENRRLLYIKRDGTFIIKRNYNCSFFSLILWCLEI